MGLLGGIFKKDKKHKGYFEIEISKIEKLNATSVKAVFNIPEKLKSKFKFEPGQYLNILVEIKGEEQRRSYSICSSGDENLAIGVKIIDKGIVSNWFNQVAKEGTKIHIAVPQGSFKIPKKAKNVVAIAAGSGITPILSILKSKEQAQIIHLLYGNKSPEEAMFINEIDSMTSISTSLFYSRADVSNATKGRIDKTTLTALIKEDLSFLEKDAFLICGPEEMILGCIEALAFFGVSKDKIIYELFTTPVNLGVEKEKNKFIGTSEITVTLDDDEFNITLENDAKSILDAVEEEGMDAPYSCRGGVCCSCKAKVTEGSAGMKLNYSLTDEEVEEGYILTCQAYPTSPIVKITYDE